MPPFIAYDAVNAYEDDIALPLKEPVKPDATTDPVTINPLGKSTAPVKYDAVTAYDPDVANDAEVANEADDANDAEVTVPSNTLAVRAVIAVEADVAVDALPNSEPVKDPVKDPVLTCSELDTRPLGIPVNVVHELATPLIYDAVNA